MFKDNLLAILAAKIIAQLKELKVVFIALSVIQINNFYKIIFVQKVGNAIKVDLLNLF